jgi:DNA-binding NarL/FixJ family response regulator
VSVPDASRSISPTRVLLVDDQPLLRTGFRMILESEPDIAVVGEAGDGEKGVDEARVLQPDVVLMDIRMPRMDGVEATRTITGADRASRVKVLILTTFDLDEYIVEGLRAGASGFLLKDVPPEELVAAIRIVARGDAVVAPTVTRRLLDKFAENIVPGDKQSEALLGRLTDREQGVLRLMSRGMSNAEIAQELYVSETTIKTHVGNVLGKLGLRDRVQAVVFAYESGLVRPGAR